MQNFERPRVIVHMMSTIDGKITSASGTDILSDEYFQLYTEVEDLLNAHAWILGRVTMQMFASSTRIELPKVEDTSSVEDFIAPHDSTNFMFGVDTKGVLRWDKNTITLSNVTQPLHLVMVVTASTPKEYISYLKQKQISYLVAGEEEIDFQLLFQKIRQNFGIDRLLLEGGGKLNGSVQASGLVDELSLLVTPTVINQSAAPAVFEREEPEKIDLQTFKLVSVQQMGKDTVWLRYEK